MGKRGPKPGAENAGRPKKEIDWQKLDAMAAIYCTGPEISCVLDISLDVLNKGTKAKHGKTFKEYLREKRGHGRAGLRRMMMQSAQKSYAMQIFLAKNWLNMSDEGFTEDDEGNEIRRTFSLKIENLEPTSDEPDKSEP